MYVYVVYNISPLTGDRSVRAVYGKDVFKNIYTKFLDSSGEHWNPFIQVKKCLLNFDIGGSELVEPWDMEN